MKLEEFKKSIDYRIINYAITKIKSVDARLNFLRGLGFKVSISQKTNKETYSGTFFVGKDGKLREQVTNRIKGKNHFFIVVL